MPALSHLQDASILSGKFIEGSLDFVSGRCPNCGGWAVTDSVRNLSDRRGFVCDGDHCLSCGYVTCSCINSLGNQADHVRDHAGQVGLRYAKRLKAPGGLYSHKAGELALWWPQSGTVQRIERRTVFLCRVDSSASSASVWSRRDIACWPPMRTGDFEMKIRLQERWPLGPPISAFGSPVTYPSFAAAMRATRKTHRDLLGLVRVPPKVEVLPNRQQPQPC